MFLTRKLLSRTRLWTTTVALSALFTLGAASTQAPGCRRAGR
jgi:hypothetical protein